MTSPLELLHPDGVVRRAEVLGGGCPDTIRPALPARADARADLVVLAPTREEAGDRGWLRDAAAAARALAPDGLVYVLAPLGRRRAVVRALRAAGLERTETLVHLPNRESSRHLVTAERRTLRWVLAERLGRTPRRRLAAAGAALPGGALALRLLAGVGIVLRPPGAPPLLGWLRRLAPEADPSRAVLTRTWREEGGSSLVHVFGPTGGAPAAVAKVRAGVGGAGELAGMEAVAARARLAGVETPVPRAAGVLDGRSAVLASAVEGRPAGLVLAGRPGRVPPLLEHLAAWLEAWNRATLAAEGVRAPAVEERLLALAGALGARLPDGAAYAAWLRELCGGLRAPVPAVAAHNDLTMANVLVGRAGRLGIVDWEEARERDLPLRDLAYAAVDAYAAAGRYASRAAAFEACFAADGDEAETVRRLLARYREALGLEPGAVVACFHACWLEHAANDVRAGLGEGSEFVAVAARVAAARDALAARLAS